ncbi:4'-phosphopantetheinyl transferase family protein [Brachybacterium sp. AOP25-B2-12]|uniref:4'-phosphopantetheinyl transferase family protein n=1 Tax=Brachybacterium sp. AOP25-B2-12 TaxID=3457710 RepID=UPI004033930D
MTSPDPLSAVSEPGVPDARTARLLGTHLDWGSVHPGTDDAQDPALTARIAALGPETLTRWRALPPGRAARFAAGRLLLADLAASVLPGATLTLSSPCIHCGGVHGAVRAEPPFTVSVSYAADLVVVALRADRTAPLGGIGVDVERLDQDADATLADRLAPLFAPHPAPDLAGWTRIEAVLKADGRGLRVPPDQVDIAPAGPRVDGGARRSPAPHLATVLDSPARWHVATTSAVPGHVVSLAVPALPGAGPAAAPSDPATG